MQKIRMEVEMISCTEITTEIVSDCLHSTMRDIGSVDVYRLNTCDDDGTIIWGCDIYSRGTRRIKRKIACALYAEPILVWSTNKSRMFRLVYANFSRMSIRVLDLDLDVLSGRESGIGFIASVGFASFVQLHHLY